MREAAASRMAKAKAATTMLFRRFRSGYRRFIGNKVYTAHRAFGKKNALTERVVALYAIIDFQGSPRRP